VIGFYVLVFYGVVKIQGWDSGMKLFFHRMLSPIMVLVTICFGLLASGIVFISSDKYRTSLQIMKKH
jgi:hypothetical protein